MKNLNELDKQIIQEDVDFVESKGLIYRGFDSSPWEGCPPITSQIDMLVRKHLPEDKIKELDFLLYGIGYDTAEESPKNICMSDCENSAWEFDQIKGALRQWLYLLLK